MTDSVFPSYFRRVHRRSHRRAATAPVSMVATVRIDSRGAKRYRHLQQNAGIHANQSQTARVTVAPVVKTTAVSSLAMELAGLKAEQDRHAAPKWWMRFAAHPVRSAIAALLLIFLIGFLAIAAPIALRSYQAYQNIFNTPIPDLPESVMVSLNAEGTPVIIETNPTQVAEVPSWDGTSRITLLLMGVDRREDEPSRSDTLILVNIDPVSRTARMISIPRDLRVLVPGKGSYKINAAYALGDSDENVVGGGPGLTMRTIETNFGINIDYYAEVDFNGFVKIVDTVGGVTLDVPYPIKDNEYPGPANQYMRIYFPSGWQHMDGERVLQYARTRHDDSDIQRSDRQQQVLLGLREQAVSLDLISSAPQLIQDVGDTVRTDLSLEQSIKLARLASEIDPEQIEQLSLDQALTPVDDGEYFFQADWDMVGEIMSSLTGETIVPQNAAIDSPRLDTGISILDGTLIPGLGGRVLEVINGNGFEDATSADLVDLGNYPTTQIIVSRNDLATGIFLARLLGVPDTAVQVNDDAEVPTPAPTTVAVESTDPSSPTSDVVVQAIFPTAEGGEGNTDDLGPPGEIIIILGDDLPDPQWYYVAE